MWRGIFHQRPFFWAGGWRNLARKLYVVLQTLHCLSFTVKYFKTFVLSTWKANALCWCCLQMLHTVERNYWLSFLFCLSRFSHHIQWRYPYPEPVYTGWSSVHWNATGMPLVDPVYTGIPLEKLSWNRPTLECHWRNLVESAPHWDATGETLTFAAYTGTPLWQPTHAPTHIVKHAE